MSDLSQFLDDLSSADPVPGGGSVAALHVSLAAALLSMVANLTIGRKKFVHVQDDVERVRAEALTLRAEAQALIQKDIDAYRRVDQCMKMPRSTDEERACRQEELQDALKLAALPPLETAIKASRVTEISLVLVHIGNKSAITDVGTAALTATAGYHAARLNVEVNAHLISDREWVRGIMKTLDAIPHPDALAAQVLDKVYVALGGSPA